MRRYSEPQLVNRVKSESCINKPIQGHAKKLCAETYLL